MRNTIIWSVILICAFSVKAQSDRDDNLSWQSLTDSAFQYWNNDELKSVDFINRAKKIIPENVIEADTNYINYIYMNGLIENSVNKDLITSQKLFKKSIDLLPKVQKNNPFLLRLYFNYARVIDELEYNTDLIIDAYKKSVKYHLKLKNPHGPTLMWSYYYIASLIHKSDSDCSKVESYYEKIIEIYNQTETPSDGLHFLYQRSNNGLRICNLENKIKYAEYTFLYCKAYNLLNPDSVDYVVNQLLNYSIPNFLFNDKFNQTKEVLDFAESLMTNKKSVLYADLLYWFAWYYRDLEEFQKSVGYSLSAIDIYNQSLDKNHKKLFKSYDFIALTYWIENKYFKAIDYYKKSIKVGEQNNDIDQKDIQDNLITIANIYEGIGDNVKSKKYRNLANLGSSENQETGDYYEDLFELHLANEDYQNALNALSKAEELYFKEQDYESLFWIYTDAVDLAYSNTIFTPDQIDYFISLMEEIKHYVEEDLLIFLDISKCMSYMQKSDYLSVKSLVDDLLPQLDENSEDRIGLLQFRAIAGMMLGDSKLAITFIDEAIELSVLLYGKDDPIMIEIYAAASTIASLLNPEIGFTYIIPAFDLIDRFNLKNTVFEANVLGAEGVLLLKLGNENGLNKLKQSVKIYEDFEVLPNYHLFCYNLLSLAGYYLQNNRFNESNYYLDKTESVLNKYSQENSILYADLLQYRGLEAVFSGKFESAITYLDQAINLYQDAGIYPTINVLNCYKGYSLWVTGSPLYGIDLIESSNSNGEGDGFMHLILYDDDKNQAREYLMDRIETLKKTTSVAFITMSDKDKQAYINEIKDNFEFLNSHIVQNNTESGFLKEFLENRFFYRGILSANTNTELTSVNNDSLADKIKLNRDLITKLLESENTSVELERLIDENQKLERSLKFSKTINQDQQISYSKLIDQLKENEVFVELIRINKKSHGFPLKNPNIFSDSIYYAAIIVEQLKDPTLLFLDTLNKFEEDVLPYYYSHVSGSKKSQVDLYSYNFLFSKIIDYCGYDKTIYVSPDGVYNNINIETLYDSKSAKYLIETSDVRLVSSARKFIENRTNNIQSHTFQSNTAILIGNPKYDLEADEFHLIASSSTRDISFFDQDSLSRNGLYQLPGTQTEVQNISELLANYNWNVSSYLGLEATENRLKEIFSPSLVHIATHGFFIPDKKTNSKGLIMGVNSNFTKDPLLRSGLLLAGAANTIKGNNYSDQNGILTSYEARELNLYNTDLVVLSACETGVGDYVSGEGVYGLQRSIMEAGAKNVIMSLWKVDDTATQMLMNYFYSNLIEKKIPIRESLKQAKISLMKDYPSPYYWGAFVLIQD